MRKELKLKRLEILDKIDALKDECDCVVSNPDCKNCKKIKKLGDSLTKLVEKRKLQKGVADEKVKIGKPLAEFPKSLTVQEYKYLRSIHLTDTHIAKVFEISLYILQRFKAQNKIITKKMKNHFVTFEDKQRVKHIIIKERRRIKRLAKKEVS